MMTATCDQFECQYQRFLFVLKMATLEAWHNAKRLRLENDAKHHYNPAQPRVPAGNPDGGQWTDDVAFGGDGVPSDEGNGLRGTISDDAVKLPEVVVTPDKPGKQPGKTPNKKIDIEKGIKTIKENAAILREKLRSQGKPHLYGAQRCAEYVRLALEAAGFIIARPNDGHGYAKNYGPSLEAVGFKIVSSSEYQSKYPPIGYTPRLGDVVVVDTYRGQRIPAGHMAMFTGYTPSGREEWHSDFDQPRGFWASGGYIAAGPAYKIYRYDGR